MDLSNQNIISSFTFTLFAGLSTGIRSALAFFTKSTSIRFLSISLAGFEGGLFSNSLSILSDALHNGE